MVIKGEDRRDHFVVSMQRVFFGANFLVTSSCVVVIAFLASLLSFTAGVFSS